MKRYLTPTVEVQNLSADVLMVSNYNVFDVIAKDFDWYGTGGAN